MLAASAAPMTGSENRISFFTPEREVNVVQPVKFSVWNALTAGSPISAAPVMRGAPCAPQGTKIMAQMMPAIAPFMEKLLAGSQGRRMGAIARPVNTAPR